MELIVPDDKLSLAIGKKGQNVRLASQLTGWRIDIHSESKVREMEARARQSLAAIRAGRWCWSATAAARRCSSWAGARRPRSRPASPTSWRRLPGIGGVAARAGGHRRGGERRRTENEERHAEEAARAAKEAAALAEKAAAATAGRREAATARRRPSG